MRPSVQMALTSPRRAASSSKIRVASWSPVAWELMGDSAKSQAIQLLMKNPQYKTWVKGVAADKKEKYAFMMAATWADYIKGARGYHSDGSNNGNTPPPTPQASQNIGYTDKFMHKYFAQEA